MTSPEKDELRHRVEMLRGRHGALGAAADALTAKLAAAEDFLRDLHLGVEGWAEIRSSDDYSNPWFLALTFKKRNDGWRLLLVDGRHGYSEADTYRELASAPLADRIAAAKVLPDLLKNITDTLDAALAELADACNEVDAVIPGARSVR